MRSLSRLLLLRLREGESQPDVGAETLAVNSSHISEDAGIKYSSVQHGFSDPQKCIPHCMFVADFQYANAMPSRRVQISSVPEGSDLATMYVYKHE